MAMTDSVDSYAALRNLREFYGLYNKMTENCFTRCVDSINSRSLKQNEMDCVDDCAQKFLNCNNILMQNFIKAHNINDNKRAKEAEAAQQQELERLASQEPDTLQEVSESS